eukprot:g11076.t1
MQCMDNLKKKYKKKYGSYRSPLMCACEYGSLKDVKLLLTGHGVNGSNGNNMTLKEYVNQVGKRSKFGGTLLTVATDQAIVDYLFSILLDGVTINANTLTGMYKKEFPYGTPLVCACQKGRLKDVKLLITGHDVNGSNGNNKMTLKEMVNQVGKESSGYDYTPLAAAIVENHKDIREYLLQNGADVYKGYKYAFPRGTPLVCACEYGRLEDVQLFITGHDVGKKKNVLNRFGKTSDGRDRKPIEVAATNGHFEIVHYLVKRGANAAGTPLICACQLGRFNDVKLLITGHDGNGSNGNNMTLKEMANEKGEGCYGRNWTPLMIAAELEHWHIAQYLIEHGEADPNIALNGWNALHLAAGKNKKNTDLIQLLLNHMTVNSINQNGDYGTPLEWCYGSNHSPIKQEIIELIRSKGGKRGFDEGEGWCIIS